jgi:uncharacterized small protein (DUF1192 family)
MGEEQNRPPFETGMLEDASQRAQLPRPQPSDDVVAPALDARAVEPHQRVLLADELDERITMLVSELGKVAPEEVSEDHLERGVRGIGVTVVIAGDDDQKPRGDERLEERAGVPQLVPVSERGQVSGDDDPIRREAQHLVDQAGDALLHAEEAAQASEGVELESPGSASASPSSRRDASASRSDGEGR